MKKKLVSLLLASTMVAGLVSGCGSTSENAGTTGGTESSVADVDLGEDSGKVINIYSWNDEFRTRVEAVYDQVDYTSDDGTITYLKDGYEIHWVVNPNQDGVYQDKLDQALMNQADADADDKVDIFLSETDYVYKYTDAEADVAVPITELGIDPDTDLAQQYDYTKTTASDQNGVQRGTTWQACPGVLAYRRDIAKEVFGTDDPEEIGKLFSDWDTTAETAETLKAAGYYTFSSYADTFRLYGNSISEPWVYDGSTTVNVGQKIIDWVNDSKTYLDNGYVDANIKGQWTDEWNKAMGSSSNVFAFLFPAWGVDFTLSPNWDGEEGTWAVTNPPQQYNWGGSYIHCATGSDDMAHARDIMLQLTADADNMVQISLETADFTNNRDAMNELSEDESAGSDFLGGENPFTYYAPVAEGIQIAPLSAYDQGCVELIQSCFTDYLNGDVTYEKAKENFETAIMERYPEITDVQWPDE